MLRDATPRNAAIQEERDKVLMRADWARRKYLDGKINKQIGNPTKVTRELALARRSAVVAFDIDHTFGFRGTAEKTVSRTLRESFGLNRGLVLAVDLKDPVDLDDERGEDDFLHLVLANHAGEQLAATIEAGGEIEAGIAVSGGRAICQLARMVGRQNIQRSLRHIQITATSGRVWAHSWQLRGPTIMRPVDADDAALFLGAAFAANTRTTISRVDHQLFSASAETAKRTMLKHCAFLPTGRWRRDERPKLAVVGVGCLDPQSGHRFADLYREPGKTHRKPDPAMQYLEEAADDLRSATDFAREMKLAYPGDVANRLFNAVPLPSEVDLSMPLEPTIKAYTRLAGLLRRINEAMVVVNWSHLANVDLLVVAGGKYKVRALWTLLLAQIMRQPDAAWPLVTELFTDTTTAATLLDARRRISTDPAMFEWYAKLFPHLGAVRTDAAPH